MAGTRAVAGNGTAAEAPSAVKRLLEPGSQSGPPVSGRAGMSEPGAMLDSVMSRRGASPVLVGRAAEMAALESALDAARQGEPAAVLVGGEAGMGKTRLIGEFTAAARGAGVRVLTGACLELGADGLPFSPFTAMLRELVRQIGPAEIAGLLSGSGRAARELARLLPELAPEAAPAGEPGGTVPVTGFGRPGSVHEGAERAGEARAHLFEGFLSLLERLAEEQPLALIVEDAHWADRSSRDLLAFLVGYQRAMRNVLIVVTFRSDELHRTHPLRPLLAELARIDWVDRAELPRLTRGQAEELAAVVLGRAPERGFADAIYDRAQGNPLFTEELLACRGDGDETCDILPDSLADLLLQAVRRLPDDSQELLRVASAGSGVTSDALLIQVTGLGAGSLIAAIRPAVAANVLVTSADGYSFRHALIQEAVHADLLPGEHAAVHTRFARAIEADPGLVPSGRAEVEKAHHWYAAHDTTGALAGSWRASVQASNAVAHAERLMLLDRVLELWNQVPDAAARIGADHVRVLEEAASAARDATVPQRGLAYVQLALSELDEATEPVRVALLLRQRYMFQKDMGKTHSVADIQRGLELVPESLCPKARTELLLAAAHCGIADNEQDRAWAADALRLARDSGDLDAEVQALANLAMIEAGPPQLAAGGSEAFRLLTQARTLARRAGAYHPILELAILETHLLCGAGEFEQAAGAARRGIADAQRYGLARTGGAFLAINLAEPLWHLGQWDEATEVIARALDLAPLPRTRVGLWLVDGSIAVARGDFATAARRAAACRAVLAAGGYDEQHHLPLAVIEIDAALAEKGPAAAVAVAADAVARFDLSSASPRYAWPVVVSAMLAAARAPGDDAGALLDRLRTVAEKLDARGPVQQAWRQSCTALDPEASLDPVAGDGGRLGAADAVVTAWEAAGQPYQTAVALAHAAWVALAERSTRPAEDRLRRAAAITAELGAAPLAARIGELSRRAGAAGQAGDPVLTARELEVLRLVASGQSNREIAAVLVISPKTASVHVSNILAKLGAATRTEAAVKAHELGLFGRLATASSHR